MTHLEEEPLNLSPPIRTWATKECPHCGETRNMTGFVEGLWEVNRNEEIRYYLFHEPYQFLSSYWHSKDKEFLWGYTADKRNEYLDLFTSGELNQIWGDGHGGWSKEYIELFAGPDQWPQQCPYGHGDIDEDGTHGCPDDCARLSTNAL